GRHRPFKRAEVLYAVGPYVARRRTHERFRQARFARVERETEQTFQYDLAGIVRQRPRFLRFGNRAVLRWKAMVALCLALLRSLAQVGRQHLMAAAVRGCIVHHLVDLMLLGLVLLPEHVVDGSGYALGWTQALDERVASLASIPNPASLLPAK